MKTPPSPAEKVRDVIRRRAGDLPVTTLPTREDVGLVTLTLDELHDVAYTAVRQACRETNTPDRDARLANHAAERATRLALAHDGYHVGTDPRAGGSNG